MGPLSKGVKDLLGAGRHTAGAALKRFVPRASEFLNRLKENPDQTRTPDEPERPIEEVPETSHDLGNNNNHDDAIFLNALLKRFVEIAAPGKLIAVGRTGRIVLIEFPTRSHDDPFDAFCRHVMDMPHAPDKVSNEKMARFHHQIPNSLDQLQEKIAELMAKFNSDIIVSAGTGALLSVTLKDIPDNVDPLQIFMDRLTAGRNDDGNPDPRNISPFNMPDQPEEPTAPFTAGNNETSVENVLQPFDEVFLAPEILNRALTAVGIQQLTKAALNKQNLLTQIKKGEVSFPNGTILNGPPGTGKSVLMENMVESYRRAGAFALEIKEGELHDGLVGGLARHLTEKFNEAIAQAKKTGLPSLVVIDEGSTLALTVNSLDSTRRYHQEGIDTFKDFITKHPEVVVVLATNVENDELDHALTRSLRLEVITIDKPDAEQQGRMFAHFLKKYGVIENLSEEQLSKLVKTLPDAQGADIRKFAQEYFDRLILQEHQRQGRRTVLDVIRHYFIDNGDELTPDDVRHLITFEKVQDDLKEFAATLQTSQTGPRRVGF